jgi:hypothetical protein
MAASPTGGTYISSGVKPGRLRASGQRAGPLGWEDVDPGAHLGPGRHHGHQLAICRYRLRACWRRLVPHDRCRAQVVAELANPLTPRARWPP